VGQKELNKVKMEMPSQIPASALSKMLGNAKKIMDKVNNTNPIVLSEQSLKGSEYDSVEEPIQYNDQMGDVSSYGPSDYTDEQVINSRLPQNIKEAMMKNRIPQTTMNSTFTLEDVSDLDDIKMTPNKRNPILKTPQVNINERVINNSDMVTISRTELKDLIQESLISFLKGSYEKNLTEATITKTINLLISQGKIGVKDKK